MASRAHGNVPVVAMLLFIVSLGACIAGEQKVNIYFNGKLFPLEATLIEHISYLPAEVVARELEVTIEWDKDKDTFCFSGKLLTGKPKDINGILYVTVTDLANALNASIRMEGRDGSIHLTYAEPGTIGRRGSKSDDTESLKTVDTNAAGVSPKDQQNAGAQGKVNDSSQTGAMNSDTFIPVIARNEIYTVEVTDLKVIDNVKDYYKPGKGNKFIMLNVSQQNHSDEVQVYPGRFRLLDEKGSVYDYLDNVSNFWLSILRPGGTNFGYVIFEIPEERKPTQLVLDLQIYSPLCITLFPDSK